MIWEPVGGLKESLLQPATLQPFQTEQDFEGITQIVTTSPVPLQMGCGKHLSCILNAKKTAALGLCCLAAGFVWIWMCSNEAGRRGEGGRAALGASEMLLWPEGIMGALLPIRQLIREHEVAVEGTILTVRTDRRSLFIPLPLNKTTHIVLKNKKSQQIIPCEPQNGIP